MNQLVFRVAFLTGVWVLLWGSLTVPNVLGGVAASLLLLFVNPDRRTPRGEAGRLRPLAIARLGFFLVGELLASNALVLREILRPRSRIRTAIVDCPVRVPSDRVMTFLANVLSLTPGTIPVELRLDPAVIVLHVLDLRDPVKLRRSVAHLERLAVEAFGTIEERNLLVAAGVVAEGAP
ncbi:MAG: Na+/H+ antiporter subunit E [Ilumatobacteraceae bacterium]